MLRGPPRTPLFPYPTLSRSGARHARGHGIIVNRQLYLTRGHRLCFVPPRVSTRKSTISSGYARHETTFSRRTCRRSEEHTSELQSRQYLVCRLLLEKKNRHV